MPLQPFSLLSTPWLPVRRLSGARSWIRPAELVQEDEGDPIVAFDWPRPDFDAACREFAIGLLSTVFWRRVADAEAWREWWVEPPAMHQLEAALAPLEPLFRLDGDGPRFMQDLEDLEARPVGISGLLIDAPGDNTLRKNLDLFVKRDRVTRTSRAAAAIALFTLQTYAPSGGAGHRTSLRGGGPFTTLVVAPEPVAGRPPSLWHQLWANVFWDERWPDPLRDPAAVFPWLGPTRTSEKGETTTPRDVHPAQVYWGMPRRIRLDFTANRERLACDVTGAVDELLVETYRTRPRGFNYAGWSRAHPLSPYYRTRRDAVEWLPLHPQPGRMAYRDWIGLVVADAGSPDAATRLPAGIVSTARRRLRRAERGRLRRLLVTGYDMDNMKARGFVESRVPLLLFDEPIREQAEEAVRHAIAGARQAERLLSHAVGRALFGRELPRDDQGERAVVRNLFWERTEPAFRAHVDRIEGELMQAAGAELPDSALLETMQTLARGWLEVLRRAALALFDERIPFELVEIENAEQVVAARRDLVHGTRGYGKAGRALFDALNLPIPEPAARRRNVA